MTVFGFLDIGSGELLVILVIALIVFGPQKLPEIARGIGKTTREFKRYAYDVQRQINQELDQVKPIQGDGSSSEVENRPMPLEDMIKPSNPSHLSLEAQPSPGAHPSAEAPPVQQKSGDNGDPK